MTPSKRTGTPSSTLEVRSTVGFCHLQCLKEKSRDELEEDIPDAEYNPNGKPSKPKSKTSKPSPPAVAEDVRAELCTLKENYDHLLSASFDLSFNATVQGVSQDPSSSQVDGGFMNDPFFSDGADLGGLLGDELARELGEGWGGTPLKAVDTDRRYHSQIL